MNKILVVLGVVFLGLLWWLTRPVRPIHFTQPIRQIAPDQISPAIGQIHGINHRNSKIHNISAEVDLTIQRQMAYRIKGQLVFEKNRKLRMLCWSALRKEIDIGSNDQFFWFWSARMKPPTLYYCPQSHISKNRLKTPFHPLWIVETLSVGQVDLKNATIVEQGKNWAVIQTRTSTMGEPVVKVTLVSKQAQAIIGHYIFDSQGRMVVSTEIEANQNVGGHIVPLRMRTIWYEEGITLIWAFRNVQVNLGINPNAWTMPNVFYRQDISL